MDKFNVSRSQRYWLHHFFQAHEWWVRKDSCFWYHLCLRLCEGFFRPIRIFFNKPAPCTPLHSIIPITFLFLYFTLYNSTTLTLESSWWIWLSIHMTLVLHFKCFCYFDVMGPTTPFDRKETVSGWGYSACLKLSCHIVYFALVWPHKHGSGLTQQQWVVFLVLSPYLQVQQ